MSLERLHIEPTRDTPEVKFTPTNKTLRIGGNSFPSNTADFYLPLIDWLEQLIQQPELDKLNVDLYFNYINTSSTKMVIRMFEVLEQYVASGRQANILWHYDEEDSNIEDLGEDLKEYVSIPFTLIREEQKDEEE